MDFSKAFVNHNIIVDKLECYAIQGVAKDWFVSYLGNKQQFVTLDNNVSDRQTISSGVPQESVLGPLLFLLYLNDFNRCSDLLDFHSFADDSNLFHKHKNPLTLQSDLINELNNVHSWLCAKTIC